MFIIKTRAFSGDILSLQEAVLMRGEKERIFLQLPQTLLSRSDHVIHHWLAKAAWEEDAPQQDIMVFLRH